MTSKQSPDTHSDTTPPSHPHQPTWATPTTTNQPTIHHPIEPLRTPSTSPPGTQKPTPLDPLHQGGTAGIFELWQQLLLLGLARTTARHRNTSTVLKAADL